MNGDVYVGGADGSALQALLVEDDDLDAEILKTIAAMNGECAIQFTHVHTLSEAARIVGLTKFDMYFVDLRLAEGSSLKLLASLEQAGARPIVFSNISYGEVERYRLNHGRISFLSKSDCSPMRINALVRDALRERAANEVALETAAE